MSASTHAVSSSDFATPSTIHALPGAVQANPVVRDLVGSRLMELDQRISAADRISASPTSEPHDSAGVQLGRRAPAADPSDHINDLASRVARLAEADDRTSRLSADATASAPIIAPLTVLTGSGYVDKPERQTPRLADLIKLKRAEMERYEAEASMRVGAQPLNRASLQPHGMASPVTGYPASHMGQPLNLNDAPHATASFIPVHGIPATSTIPPMPQGGFVPPTPPRTEPSRERTGAVIGARMSELRDEGFSSSLYGFGAGLGIALMSGAALYVILRLV